MSIHPPPYGIDQAMSALALANVVRTTNARLLRRIGSVPQVDGIDVVIDVLRSGDVKGPAGALTILRLLCAPDHMGEEKARKLLKAASILTGDRRLRELTVRQREVIAWNLENPDVLWPATTLLAQRRRRAA